MPCRVHVVYSASCMYLFRPIFVKKKGSNIMPRKFVMPDPADRSKNEPAVILSPTQVLGLYNQEQERSSDKKTRIVDSVKETVVKSAKDAGWDEAEPIGNQILLRNKWSD